MNNISYPKIKKLEVLQPEEDLFISFEDNDEHLFYADGKEIIPQFTDGGYLIPGGNKYNRLKIYKKVDFLLSNPLVVEINE